jgi:hypothetical protein
MHGVLLRINTALICLFTLLAVHSSNAGIDCPFLTPVEPLQIKDSVPGNRSLVSLAWLTKKFNVKIQSSDTTDKCTFDLNAYLMHGKGKCTKLFSVQPGTYVISYEYRHEPGSHFASGWRQTRVEVKPDTFYTTRFVEVAEPASKISVQRTLQIELVPRPKVNVIKHAAGERPGIRTVVLVGTICVAVMFGALVVYLR